ncbi:MAG: helix-turn-helix transcriptional regulator [Candidatus Aminicenantes bacterium]|nr:MAG: helix-turn-helix transcriptional regulator [Candidatus Aminicenantes bacterium]
MEIQLRADDSTVLWFANRLYERAEEPAGWEEALQEITDALQGKTLCLHRYQLKRRSGLAIRTLRGITPEQAREYHDHHAQHNAWMARLPGVPRTSDVLVGHEVCPEDELFRHRFYHDFLEPMGLSDLIATVLEADASTLTTVNVLRGTGPGRYDDNESQFMRRLAPHLCNVYRVECRFAKIRSERALLREVIDRIPTAVLAVDRNLRIVEANRAAEALLASNDGLRVSRGVLEIFDCVARDGMQEALGALAAMQRGQGVFSGASIPIGRPSVARPYVATVMPLRPMITDASTCEARCLLFIDQPDLEEVPGYTRTQQLWGLTRAEAKVAHFLASGLSPREISDRLGISFNTVRSHVQKIYFKTDTSRQSDLVRLLTRLSLTVSDRFEDDLV